MFYILLAIFTHRYYPALHKAAMSLGNLHINNIARDGHRYENHHPFVVSHRLTLGRQSRYLQPLNQGHRSLLSCHLFKLWHKDTKKRKTENGKRKTFSFRLERESGTDAAEREQSLLADYALREGGKAHAVGLKRKTFFDLRVER